MASKDAHTASLSLLAHAGMRLDIPAGPAEGVSDLGSFPAFTGATGVPSATSVAVPLACAWSSSRDTLIRRSLMVADLLATVLALAFTIVASSHALHFAWGSLVGLPAVVVAAKVVGLYDRDESLIRKTTLDEAPKLFHLATIGTLLVWLGDDTVVGGGLWRSGALLLWVTLTVMLIAMRAGARRLALRLAPTERCLFIGDLAGERRVRSKLFGTRAEIVAHVEPEDVGSWSPGGFTSERLSEIRKLARTLDVHRAIVAPGAVEGDEVLDLVCALKAVGVRVSVLPRLLEVMGSSVEFDDLYGVTLMGVRRFALTRSSLMVKRVFDFLGAGLALLAAAPILAVIAVAIKLDSRGPVFFRQSRVGRHGEGFEIFKFRTMISGAEHMRAQLADRNEAQEGLFKIAEDPRITRVGRLLRKSCLDELPQLLNILRGEMSLVGPRPLVAEEDVRLEGRHRRRLELLPGITGPWQILGPARVPLLEMATIDYLYAGNWSLWTDLKILLRTVPHVLARKGL